MSDYYDIQDILAEEERLPVKFRAGGTQIGRAIDPSCDDDDLKEGAKVDLPFWMVKCLAPRNMVEVKLPKFYGDRVRREVQADPGCVSVREYCPFFYEFGLKAAPIVPDTSLTDFLVTTFRGRYQEVLTRAHSCTDQDFTALKRLLSREEVELMEAGHQSMASHRWWLQRLEVLKIAPILRKSKKRNPMAAPAAGARDPLAQLDPNAEASKRARPGSERER